MSRKLPSRGSRALRPRGYLLLEVMVGGVLTSVVLAGLLIHLGAAHTASTHAARESTARQIVRASLEEARAVGFNGVTSSTVSQLPGFTGIYARTITVSAVQTETYFGSEVSRYKTVTARVDFNLNGKPKDFQEETRVYER